MLAKLFLQYMLASVFGVGIDTGYATLYGIPGDQHLGSGYTACEKRPVPQGDYLCAHRWLPCGTRVLVVNEKGDTTYCRIGDRGPYGVDRSTGRWKGILDMAPKPAWEVIHGKNVVNIVYTLPPYGHGLYENTQWLWPSRKTGPSM